jgi:hypothetical protein
MIDNILQETDPDLAQAGEALKRAAQRAWAESVRTNTPFIVYKDGEIIDLRRETEAREGEPALTNGGESR